jgi:hypothetical protein
MIWSWSWTAIYWVFSFNTFWVAVGWLGLLAIEMRGQCPIKSWHILVDVSRNEIATTTTTPAIIIMISKVETWTSRENPIKTLLRQLRSFISFAGSKYYSWSSNKLITQHGGRSASISIFSRVASRRVESSRVESSRVESRRLALMGHPAWLSMQLATQRVVLHVFLLSIF